MAATKSSSSLQVTHANTAGSTLTSTTLDIHTAYDAVITAQVTNGATGPTVACNVTINISADGTTFFPWAKQTAGVSGSTTYPFSFYLPDPVAFAQVVFSGNTGQTVSGAAQAQFITGL